MMFLWMVIGAVLGGLVSEGRLYGFVFGAALGLLWGRQGQLSRELKDVRTRLASLSTAARTRPAPADERPSMTATEARDTLREPEPPAIPPAVLSTPPRIETPAPAMRPAPMPPRPEPSAPRQPSGLDRLLQRVWHWFTEGNVPVKIGMLVLFAGVAALLKYASDAGLLHTPPALRVSLIALAAIAGLAFGWRRRHEHRVFALSVQGGAIGVLVITVFAAFRLYDLLPAGAAFALLIVLVAGIGVLAVMQDALALAVLGLLAGFAAPILVSTGQGSHVALFSYYAVLNLAILGIAWKRSWRVLNLLGFIATFGIGSAWGVLRYEPALFASTEPFLVLNFLFYLVIPWLHVLRAPVDRKLVIDGCLMFGNPLISLLLQGALLRWDGTGLAISTLVAAAIYLAVAYVARRHPAMRLLRDTWAVLAVAFATLAVPLALRADVTGSIFALEGAGLIWLGLRQQRRLACWSGLALQLLAAGALLLDRYHHGHGDWLPLLNRGFISALLLVAAGFASSRVYARLGGDGAVSRLLAVLLYAWGVLWWWGACAEEITRFVPATWQFAAWLGWLALTAWGAAEAARRKPLHELGVVLSFSPAVGMAITLPLLLGAGIVSQQPLKSWDLLAVAAAAVLGWRSLVCLRDFGTPAALAQLAWLWRWVLIAAVVLYVWLDRSRWLSDNWVMLLGIAPLLFAFAIARWRPRLLAAPLADCMPLWLPPLRYSLLAVLGLLGVVALFQGGDAAPLRFIPLLNPIELLMLLIAGSYAVWLTDPALPSMWKAWRGPVLGGIVLVLATDFTLRDVHQLAGVDWDGSLASSSLAQMSLTVVWSVLGLFAWVWGSRHAQRLAWLAGAVILGVVLVKLIVVDRRHLGNLFGIGSFIAFGLLCSVIGYLAPAPPRRSSMEETRHAP
ncbi:DUF2339 domain-containing protein [Dyella jiangningensis]|uniref:DUF2339 domain-containing protein n=1 Tax=Dyella jiangningensis TaxID=1379159 RepID=A0A328PE78_9GAMM|nr:DUF2339 domain-containing protein [Dyella jiangningensis]RAO78044.1 hypothetical protein CA260_09510 [Dyella jiangningensis]